MTPSLRLNLLAIVVLCLLVVNALPATANSVSVTGTGHVGGFSVGFDITSAGFTAFESLNGGGQGYISTGTVGVPMKLIWSVDAFPGPELQTTATVGGQFTDLVGGGLVFTSTFTIPASALLSGTFTVPVDVTGYFLAFQDLSLGKGFLTPGPFLGGITFTGTGTATFDILDLGQGSFEIVSASSTFSGTGRAVTPEPTSLLLMATGLAALGLVVRRKRGLSETQDSQLLG